MQVKVPAITPGYMDDEETAAYLGRDKDWFQRNRRNLEAADFPKKDSVLKRYCVEDVQAWMRKRRTVADPVERIDTDDGDKPDLSEL